MVIANQLTEDNLRDYVLRRLGFPAVVVELAPSQIDDAIDDVLRQVNQHMFRAEPKVLARQYGHNVAIGLGDESRGVIIVKALFPKDEEIYAQLNIFELMYRLVYPRLPIGEWYQLRSFYEMYQRVRGTEPDWYVDEMNKILYVDCISGPYDIFYVPTFDLTMANFFTGKRMYLQLLLDGIIARSKLTLSQIRGKFTSTIPAPGGSLTTNADVLRSEGEAEWTRFLDRIRSLGVAESAMFWG